MLLLKRGSGIDIKLGITITGNFFDNVFYIYINQGEADNYHFYLNDNEINNYQWDNNFGAYMVRINCQLGDFDKSNKLYLKNDNGDVCSIISISSAYGICNSYLKNYYNNSSQQKLLNIIKSLIILNERYLQYIGD